jgi:FKBP-type peptidyl-prolyl cis-trans isomerase FklB
MNITLAGEPAPAGPAAAPTTAPAAAGAPKSQAFKTQKDERSYCLGVETAKGFKREGMDIDVDLMTQGMKDVLAGNKTLITDAELKSVMAELVAEVQAKMSKARLAVAESNKKAGEAFLAANKDKPGVVALPDGLQYKILKAGTGAKPTEEQTIVFFYRCTLIDGTQCDSAPRGGKPMALKLADRNLMAGFREALKLMPAGSKWQIFIPSDLAYGPTGTGGLVGPNATLVYEVELVGAQ